jgi:hypothetical protein
MWQRVIRGSDGNRPAETDVARINWIIGSAYTATVSDAGLISSTGPVNMDATDYRGRYPADVAADCGNASQKNYFVYFDEATWHPAFAYFDPTSTTYTSTLQFSNVDSDVDSSTTFAATGVLDLDPSAVYSGVYLRYAGGTVYRQNTTTLSDIGIRDASIDEPDIKTHAAAIIRADAYLVAAGVEQKTLKIHTELPSTHVNLVLPGQRVRVKFSHLTGYTSFAYARVVTRTVSQAEGSDKVYIVELECRNPKLMGGLGAGGTPPSAGTTNGTLPFVAGETHFMSGTFTFAGDGSGESTEAEVFAPSTTYTITFTATGPGSGISSLDAALVVSATDYPINATANLAQATTPTIFSYIAVPGNVPQTVTGTFTTPDAAHTSTLALHFGASAGLTPHDSRSVTIVYAIDVVGAATTTTPSTGQPVLNQTPTPAADGSTTAFTNPTPAAYITGSLRVLVDDIDQTDHVTETSTSAGTWSLDFAPAAGDIIRVSYQSA